MVLIVCFPKLLLLGTPQMLKRMSGNFRLIVLDKEISRRANSARDLGVIMDASLSYDEHFTQIFSKCTYLVHVYAKSTLLSTS